MADQLQILIDQIANQQQVAQQSVSSPTAGDEFSLQAMQAKNMPQFANRQPQQNTTLPIQSLEAALLAKQGENVGRGNISTSRMAERRFNEQAVAAEHKVEKEQQDRKMAAQDQRYNDFKQIYGELYKSLTPQTLESVARQVALGADPKNVLPNYMSEKERQDIAGEIHDDAKKMIDGSFDAQRQLKILNDNIEKGWKGQGAGQVAALYSFITSLDPESTVREGEVALAREAESILNWFKSKYEKVSENTVMSEEMYKDIINLTQDINQINRESYQDQYVLHGERADEAGIPRQKVWGETFDARMRQPLEIGKRYSSPEAFKDAVPPPPKGSTSDRLNALEAKNKVG